MLNAETMQAWCKIRIPGNAERILKYIILRTNGGKTSEKISNSDFVKGTGIRKTHVSRNIETLIDMNLIGKKVTKNGNFLYSFNTRHWNWKKLPKKVTVTKNGNSVTKNGNSIVRARGITTPYDSSINNSKFNEGTIPNQRQHNQRETCNDSYMFSCSSQFLSDLKTQKPTPLEQEKLRQKPVDRELAKLLCKLIKSNNPNNRTVDKYEEEGYVTPAKYIRLMREQDKRSPEDIKAVIEWSQRNRFWRTNILSTSKLRKQFDQLQFKMQSEKEFQENGGDVVDYADLERRLK